MIAKRVFILGLVAIPFAFGSIVAGSALGAEYIYKVNKTTLGVGQKEEEALKAKTNQTMSSTFLGVKLEVVCKNAKLDAAEEPVIKGGVPGTSARDRFEFSECQANLSSAKCKEVTVEGGRLTGEIVTVVLPAAKAGELATKFSPSENSFAKIKLNCDSLLFEVTFAGTTAMLDTPEKIEQSVGTLIAKAGTEAITEVRKSNGGTEKVGLNCNGERATFEGESELALVSNHSWGVF
jgi:hypothetical protein